MLHLLIHNDGTGDERVGNYNLTVKINQRVITTGRMEGFERNEGAIACLEAAVKALKGRL